MLARLLHRYISIWLAGAGGAETVLDRLQDGATSSGWGPLAVGGIDAGGALSSGAGVVDDLDLDDVEWLHADVSGWRVTSKITNVSIDDDSLTIDHSMAGRWPTLNLNGDQIEGNPWVFVNRGGKWYAATYEWLRSGQVTKRITAGNIGSHTKKEPLESWAPQPGELVGFMVSTPARLGERTVNERSNVVLARWPG